MTWKSDQFFGSEPFEWEESDEVTKIKYRRWELGVGGAETCRGRVSSA